MNDDRFAAWIAALEDRHLASLRFSEVSRALRALSSAYVERRDRLAHGAALDGGGKRAAFALFYGPLHYLTVREIVSRLPAGAPRLDTVVDLGCGTGAAGAAWATALETRPVVVGIDRHHWAVGEAAWTYSRFGLRARTHQADSVKATIPTRRSGLVAGWLANELTEDGRAALRQRLSTAQRQGATLLVVEPIARSIAPWWDQWVRAFEADGGRSDEWRLTPELPEIVQRLTRAAGLTRNEVTARSLWVPGREQGPGGRGVETVSVSGR